MCLQVDNSSHNTLSATPAAQSAVSVFKTGYKHVDDHSKPSRLDGETGAMVNSFRQLKLKEYHRVMVLCKNYDVVLNRQLLDRGRLFSTCL